MPADIALREILIPFRHGAAIRRATLAAIAVFAILLQACLPIAKSAETFGVGVTCATDASRPDAPHPGPHHHDGSCCVLACAACGCAYIATGFRLAFFPVRKTILLAWNLNAETTIPATVQFKFAARGPPLVG